MDTNEWYNNKLNQFGKGDFRSLNWGDKEGKSAEARYQQMFKQFNWSSKKVLEIGCGWGSFFDFGFTCSDYCGIDINPNLIKIATEKYPDKAFRVDNITKLTPTKMFDVAISSGVAGNRQGPADTPEKLTYYLNFMFSSANTIMINFPSNRATIRTEHVEYFAPEYVISQALNITNNIQLIHKNLSDFLLILKHNE